MVSIKALLVLVVCTISFVSAEDCHKFFTEDLRPAAVSKICGKTLNLANVTAPMTEEEFKQDYDDKCFAKCFMEKMGMIKDGQFDKDFITADIKAHVTDDATQNKVIEYTLKCIDEADQAETDPCKKFSRFMTCSTDQEQLLVC